MTVEPVPEGVPSTHENPYEMENMLDPFPLYERMRAREPVLWLEEVGVWAAFMDDACREVVNDWKRFGSAGGGGVANYYREKPWREPSVIFEADPPDHTRTRQVLSRILSPGTVRALTDQARELAKECVTRAMKMDRFDVVADLAKPFVMRVVPDAVGLPEENRENLLLYNKYLIKGRTYGRHNPWTAEELDESERIVEWVREVCNRESITSDGLGAQIYEAADAGDISVHEANMLIRSFLSAGTDTTFGAISNAVLFLLQDPSQWEMLRADPSLSRNAFDEGIRFRSPAQTVARNTLEEMEFHGVQMGKYDKIIAFVGSANRDPKRWKSPDRFDIHRKVVGHLGLGGGIHGCVGQMIARMEGDLLIGELARHAKTIDLADEPFQWSQSGRAVGKLPVVVS